MADIEGEMVIATLTLTTTEFKRIPASSAFIIRQLFMNFVKVAAWLSAIGDFCAPLSLRFSSRNALCPLPPTRRCAPAGRLSGNVWC
jgi:hypothetical protein